MITHPLVTLSNLDYCCIFNLTYIKFENGSALFASNSQDYYFCGGFMASSYCALGRFNARRLNLNLCIFGDYRS